MGIQMLKLHWKGARWFMLPVLVAAFGLPMMAGRAAWGSAYVGDPLFAQSAWSLINQTAAFGLVYPLLAAVCGSIVALTAWNWDHQAGHIYSLSLPISRWKYTAMKFGGGVIIILATSGTFLLGASISSTLMNLPAGLEAYPVSLSSHFLLASLTAYALLFALAAGTMKTSVVVISFTILSLLFGNGVFDLAANFHAPLGQIDVPMLAFEFLLGDGGPLEVFAGNWSLIDV